MSNEMQTATMNREPRGCTDLCGQYRPIGIGAVAAALSATGKDPDRGTLSAANSNDRRNEHERHAAAA